MIVNLLTEVFAPRYPRGYVGRHRAPRHLRRRAAAPTTPATADSTG